MALNNADTEFKKFQKIVHAFALLKTQPTPFNSLASKFVLRAQPLSAEIKMSPRAPNCTLNDFYVLTLPLAMGSDAVP